MVKIMQFLLLFVFFVSLAGAVIAQKRATEWQSGYFAPYLVNIGSTVGYAFDVEKWEENSDKNPNSEHRIQVLTQLSYFTQLNVSNNVVLNPEIVYRWNKSGKRFFLSSSIGTGYLLSFQRQEGTLDLATGETEYRNNTLSYFLPNMNVGLGLDPRKHIGFYLKAIYGRKLSRENANAAFLGLSAGFILKIKSTE